jgi:RNA polymerase sigma-70 factor (ECF subfamily)
MTDTQVSPLPGHLADSGHASNPVQRDERLQFISTLFERHRDPLMRHLTGLLSRRADAEDVLQETCTRLLKVKHLERTPARARAYMFKVATNLAYDRFRSRSREHSGVTTDELALADVNEQPDVIVGFEQGIDIMKKTLRELRPRCRQVFLLRAAGELSYESIGRRLGVSKRTVEREMQHALETCQRRLKR